MVQTEIPVSVQFQMLRTVELAHLGDLAKTSALLLADDYPLMLKSEQVPLCGCGSSRLFAAETWMLACAVAVVFAAPLMYAKKGTLRDYGSARKQKAAGVFCAWSPGNEEFPQSFSPFGPWSSVPHLSNIAHTRANNLQLTARPRCMVC